MYEGKESDGGSSTVYEGKEADGGNLATSISEYTGE